MSAIDQAFVKAYARRQLANSKPGPHFLSDDGLAVAPSAADTASVWIDQAGDTNLRVDVAHASSTQPVLPKSLMPKSTLPAAIATEAKVSEAKVTLEETAVLESQVSTQQRSAAADAHVHTAYAIVEGDSSWLSILAANHPSPALMQQESVVQDSVHSLPELTENETIQNRVDLREKVVDAPHLSKVVKKEILDTKSPEPVAAFVASQANPTRELVGSNLTDAVALKQAKKEFRASWEIDALDVPPVVADLFFDSGLFQQVAEQLADAAATGLRKVLVTSVHGGEGRSTIAIGLAIAAAASGQRVALVDGDATSPTLVDDLRLDLEFGWIEALRGKIPLQEICVHATQDAVTFVPLLTPHGANAATAEETRMLIDSLESSFDLIIVDGGSSDCEATEGSSGQYDSAMIVFDQTRTARADINEYSYRLRLSGIAGVGVVENFVG